MKCLIVTSLKECQQDVEGTFQQARVPVYSAIDASRFKNEYVASLSDNWFGGGSASVNAVALFSFTKETVARRVVSLVDAYNDGPNTPNPIRVFILPVEAASQKP